MMADAAPASSSTAPPLLEIRNLQINFYTYRGVVKALQGINLELRAGESMGLVGETGCGKSVTARAVIGFVEPPGRIEAGEILLEGNDLLKCDKNEMRSVRGRKISFIFQEPKKALDPTARIASQLIEAATTARGIDARAAHQLVLDTLQQVGLGDAERVMRSYSFELSGGMAQRVMIAMAVLGGSRLIIADEPTSALDVSIQAQILRLLSEIRTSQGSALLLITHDLGVAAENCDRICVMYAGRIVEMGPVADIFASPAHPYTNKLLRALPAPGKSTLESIPGMVPDLVDPPPGCRFSNRCDRASERCTASLPRMEMIMEGHFAACFHPVEARQPALVEGEV
jgi:peptide/nickel transport system ATP-binding protein